MAQNTNSLWERVYALLSKSSNDDILPQLDQLMVDIDAVSINIAEKALLTAYLAYHFPCGITEQIDIESELNMVLQHDPTNLTAHLYLGHWYYDCRQFSKAIHEFEQIDVDTYLCAGQNWQAIKIHELLFAAKVHCGSLEGMYVTLEQLLQEFRNTSPDNLAVPTELVMCLHEHRDRLEAEWGPNVMKRLAPDLRKIVDAIAGREGSY